MIIPMLTGLLTGLTLIIAIGAQNAFVLRQGLARSHVGLVVAICAASDAVLITAGVAGLGALVTAQPALLTVIRWAGAAFLIGYGALAIRRALRPGRLVAAGETAGSAWSVAAKVMALTWLNPHVYLDTVLLLGSIASQQGDPGRWWFAGGAVVASIGWFTALGFGARALRPLLATPAAWRVLDVVIGAIMIGIAIKLLLGG
ncbi:LysE/ArgO family amino acid transporter [Naumannella huperziae]